MIDADIVKMEKIISGMDRLEIKIPLWNIKSLL